MKIEGLSINKTHWNEAAYEYMADGVSWGTARDLYHGHLWGFCCCGNAEDTMQRIVDLFDLIQWNRETQPSYEAYEKEREARGFTDKAAYLFLLYWMDSKNYLEHGGSVYWAWPTELGEQVHADLKLILAQEKD